MTETFLRIYLRLSGLAAILAVFINFAVTLIQRNIQMAEMDVDAALRSQTNLSHAIGFGFEIPIALTFACLCLMASQILTYKRQTIQTVFE